MGWIDWALAVCGIAAAFGIGFYCGYVKDKKEANDLHEEALRLNAETDRNLKAAQKALEDAEMKLNTAKGLWEETDKRLNLAMKICQGKAEDEDFDSL